MDRLARIVDNAFFSPRIDDASLVSRELHAREGHCLSRVRGLFLEPWLLTRCRDRAKALVKPRSPSSYLRTKCRTGVNRHRYQRRGPLLNTYTHIYICIHTHIYIYVRAGVNCEISRRRGRVSPTVENSEPWWTPSINSRAANTGAVQPDRLFSPRYFFSFWQRSMMLMGLIRWSRRLLMTLMIVNTARTWTPRWDSSIQPGTWHRYQPCTINTLILIECHYYYYYY